MGWFLLKKIYIYMAVFLKNKNSMLDAGEYMV